MNILLFDRIQPVPWKTLTVLAVDFHIIASDEEKSKELNEESVIDLSLWSGKHRICALHIVKLPSQAPQREKASGGSHTHAGTLPTDSRSGPASSHGIVQGQMWLWLCLHQKKSAVTGNGSFEKSKKKNQKKPKKRKDEHKSIVVSTRMFSWRCIMITGESNHLCSSLLIWCYIGLCAKTLVEALFTRHIAWHVGLCYVYEQETLMVLPVRGCEFPVSAVCFVKHWVVQDSWMLE